MGGFLLGLVIGLVVGGGAVYYWLRREGAGVTASPGGSVAPEPSLAAPIAEPAAPAPAPASAEVQSPPEGDEDMKQALDATKGLLDELEGRYRGRRAPADDAGAPTPPKRPRPPRPKP